MNRVVTVAQWEEVELQFQAVGSYARPYLEVEMSLEFEGPDGVKIQRPAFWDGGNVWKVRFASPVAEGEWKWRSFCNTGDAGLDGQTGVLKTVPYHGTNKLLKHGLLKMSSGKRNVVHADGKPFLVVGDTAWALPFRGTEESVEVYAEDRQKKGFNATLLMTVQPDKFAEGPRNRHEVGAFDVGFEDLPTGHINQINVAYFQYLDKLINILVDHEIVPIYQPVFHGFGWKGKSVAGGDIPGGEYGRYCRYLVARYGAKPAMWLVAADGFGTARGVAHGGIEIEEWDAYRQPTGIHYNPWADNKAYQASDWLDFQLCQTGHNNEHRVEKVAEMYVNQPVKACANGEPTYERMCNSRYGLGWWQGHEAWINLMAGGTMGVFYGAAGLWQWKLFPDESGWDEWCDAIGSSWREALEFEGSVYAGNVGKALAGLPLADMEQRLDLTFGRRCLAVEDQFYCVYLEDGGWMTVKRPKEGLPYRWFDPVGGVVLEEGILEPGNDQAGFPKPLGKPLVFVAGKKLWED